MPRQKNIYLWDFFICSICLNVVLPPTSQIQLLNILDFWNSWGKVMKRNGLRFEKLMLIKGLKLPRNLIFFILIFFFSEFCLTSRIFLLSLLLFASVMRFFVSCVRYKKNIYIKKNYQVLYVRCHVSCVTCRVSPVTFHMSLTPTATATDPPPANSPKMHSRMLLFHILASTHQQRVTKAKKNAFCFLCCNF